MCYSAFYPCTQWRHRRVAFAWCHSWNSCNCKSVELSHELSYLLWGKSSESVQSTCWRPVTHAQIWASYSAVYRFGSLSYCGPEVLFRDLCRHEFVDDGDDFSGLGIHASVSELVYTVQLPCFFAFTINFVTLLCTLYHSSWVWQLLLKNFMMMMMMWLYMCETRFVRDATFLIDRSLQSRSYWSAPEHMSGAENEA